MLAWLPDSSRGRLGLDYGCLQTRAHAEVSHDDLYHTVLGVMELRNDAYDPQRDLLAPCMAPRTHLAASTAAPTSRTSLTTLEGTGRDRLKSTLRP
jgi:lipid A ethanolaminephosphotransferase